jgi:hypothetical protein
LRHQLRKRDRATEAEERKSCDRAIHTLAPYERTYFLAFAGNPRLLRNTGHFTAGVPCINRTACSIRRGRCRRIAERERHLAIATFFFASRGLALDDPLNQRVNLNALIELMRATISVRAAS